MSDRELLEEISETVRSSELKLSAIRDRIASLLLEAGYLDEEDDEDDAMDDE